MKRLIFFISIVTVLAGCKKSDGGYLVGVQNRGDWYQPDPYGMLFIPMGSYNMGPSDQDVPYSQTAQSKTVSVAAFYMDETEITNNEYRQFVEWVRDSIALTKLGTVNEETYLIKLDEFGQDINPPFLNWEAELNWKSTEDDERAALQDMYIAENERFYRRKEIDTRKLLYKYYWVDLKAAAQRENRGKPRNEFIIERTDPIYPDTLAWIHDFTYSYNEPMAQMYFWHPAYDNYPVVGVSWIQARAFCIWRTQLLNSALLKQGDAYYNDFRLPTESEWEWAARGGLDLSPYPWGGPYSREKNGCFLANFKPLRGNYVDDGGFNTLIVGHYQANENGLYDMAGNVSEWTSNAYDESALNFAHDMNMDYFYEAKQGDPEVLKRKVIRGGSWKDVGYYLQTASRTYEYQDTSKCYIGFRCVQSYLGRSKGDGTKSSKVYQ